MAREFVMAEYIDDQDTPWLLKVRSDYASDPARGWALATLPGLHQLPRLWFPRRVVGLDVSGRTVYARVASTRAPLWTGAETVFFVRGNDGAFVSARVTAYQGEKQRGG